MSTVIGLIRRLPGKGFVLNKLNNACACCCCWSVAKSCPTLCNPMNCSMSGFPVLHYLQEFAQTLVSWNDDAIQPFHSLPSPSPPAWSFSQHQGLFQWPFASGGQSIGASTSAAVLPINIQSWFHLGLTDFISLQSKGLSRVFSSTTVGKHEFFSTQPSLGPKSPIHSWLLEKPLFWLYGPLSAKWYLCFLMPVHTMI